MAENAQNNYWTLDINLNHQAEIQQLNQVFRQLHNEEISFR